VKSKNRCIFAAQISRGLEENPWMGKNELVFIKYIAGWSSW
jgi:hypothetical protein